MRLNGLWIVCELAVREAREPIITRYRDAFVLGSLREDVWYVPALGFTFEHLSFSHFYKPGLPGGLIPLLWWGPRIKARKFYRRALAEWRAGRRASAFVQLGRVAHLLTDMACPVHATRTAHETDPFEWFVEGNVRKLGELPVPHVPDARGPEELIEDMARFTQAFAPDGTNTWWGRILARLGLRERVTAKEAGRQARELIPRAGGAAAALLRMFARDALQGERDSQSAAAVSTAR